MLFSLGTVNTTSLDVFKKMKHVNYTTSFRHVHKLLEGPCHIVCFSKEVTFEQKCKVEEQIRWSKLFCTCFMEKSEFSHRKQILDASQPLVTLNRTPLAVVMIFLYSQMLNQAP